MKKIIALLVIPIISLSLAFTQESVNVEQKTENKGDATQIKNQERTRNRSQKKSMKKQMQQIRAQNKDQRKDMKGGK